MEPVGPTPTTTTKQSQWQKQMKNDLVSVIAQNPEIPVGGRLSHFLPQWKNITTDKWVLDVISQGYKLEFVKVPPFLGIKSTNVPRKNESIIKQEIDALLQKNAIEKVSQRDIYSGFYSTLFLVPKKNGEMRPVINLKPLNKYIRKQHFKMDTLTKVLNLVEKGDWAFTIDLKDAYFHIKIFKNHRKFLRFHFQGVTYQFRALCFGPTSSPRVFVKIITVVLAHLRKLNIRLAGYLDDWLTVNKTKAMLLKDQSVILNLLYQLGFIVNKAKSQLVPVQALTYLGSFWDFQNGMVLPSAERLVNLKNAVFSIQKGNCTARHFLILLGMIASCLELIPNARLFMRPIQLHLLKNWSPARMKLSVKIPLTPKLIQDLTWFSLDQNIGKGRSLVKDNFLITLTTDASGNHGWGGHMNNLTCQGRWTLSQQMLHINCQEMLAVHLSLNHFLEHLKGQNVLIRSDNTTVCQYINHQGGTRSAQLCNMTMDLWLLALKNNIRLKSVYIQGKKNVVADTLSRVKVCPLEWSLSKTVVSKLFHQWGQPMMDLFATYQNKQTPLFCSWINHPQAFALDALSIPWENVFAYAFPPMQLVPKVLCHMQKFCCTIILIASQWPRQHHYPLLLSLLIANPIKLPCSQDLLTQCRGRVSHPHPESLNLTAWLLSTDVGLQKAFLKTQESYCQSRGVQALEKITKASSKNLIAGVVKGKLIRILPL
jgi:mRNA-degrading endonuclease HigB of HigAB toxin-antitoxin module